MTGTTIDKSAWGPGPWQGEPDYEVWRHAGFQCMVRRVGFSGAWTGYVALLPTHSWSGRDYDAIDAEVHGGLTWAGPLYHNRGVEFLPAEDTVLWWIGFDCAHAGDFCPAMKALLPEVLRGMPEWETYKDIAYAKSQTEQLARQAARAA